MIPTGRQMGVGVHCTDVEVMRTVSTVTVIGGDETVHGPVDMVGVPDAYVTVSGQALVTKGPERTR